MGADDACTAGGAIDGAAGAMGDRERRGGGGGATDRPPCGSGKGNSGNCATCFGGSGAATFGGSGGAATGAATLAGCTTGRPAVCITCVGTAEAIAAYC